MPEGDTIFRAATTLRKWIEGRAVTAASARSIPIGKCVGASVTEVEARAKHLLIRFDNGLTLHTHMRMTGSWHVYSQGDSWSKPARQAVATIECGERIAVCFNAPVVELMMTDREAKHDVLRRLGPDVLANEPFDFDEVRRRANLLPATTALGDLLLDQRIASGIGNVYRCETLFIERINPWTTRSQITDEQFDQLLRISIELMTKNAHWSRNGGRDVGAGSSNNMWVYGRANRPCRVCGTLVKKSRMGPNARDIFWCPKCQPQ